MGECDVIRRKNHKTQSGFSCFFRLRDQSFDLMSNTGQSRDGLSFRKKLHRIIQNITALPLVLNRLHV